MEVVHEAKEMFSVLSLSKCKSVLEDTESKLSGTVTEICALFISDHLHSLQLGTFHNLQFGSSEILKEGWFQIFHHRVFNEMRRESR